MVTKPIPTSPKPTERDVQNAIWLDVFNTHPMSCPNYTPAHWYESDVFAVTRAGYGVEFEIKLSIGDFRADARKGRDSIHPKLNGLGYEHVVTTKHSRLEAHDTAGPPKFWYVVPEGMVGISEVPSWAGLKTFSVRGGHIYSHEALAAPRLHLVKVTDKTLSHICSCLCFRYWHLRRRTHVLDATGMETYEK